MEEWSKPTGAGRHAYLERVTAFLQIRLFRQMLGKLGKEPLGIDGIRALWNEVIGMRISRLLGPKKNAPRDDRASALAQRVKQDGHRDNDKAGDP